MTFCDKSTALHDIAEEEEVPIPIERDAPALKDVAATSAEADEMSEDIAESNGSDDEELDELVGSEGDEHRAEGTSFQGGLYTDMSSPMERKLRKLGEYFNNLGDGYVGDGDGTHVDALGAVAGAGHQTMSVIADLNHEDKQDDGRSPAKLAPRINKVRFAVSG